MSEIINDPKRWRDCAAEMRTLADCVASPGMVKAIINDPKSWRDRAAEMRTLVGSMASPEMVKAMHKLAANYDRMAERIEERRYGRFRKQDKRQ